MARATKVTPTLTTAQQLGRVVKSARDIMRKDKGLNGDLDRLPMLTWLMFLKFLDDQERVREAEAELANRKYHPIIGKPYRWRDWGAMTSTSLTGDDLLKFVNNDEATRPDDTTGPGLFAYLRGLQGNGDGRRNVVATVFRGTTNRMSSGYLLRDVIGLVDRIHFDSSEEIQTLGHLYETMLKEMRDAAGDSGEFYTPRAVVRFMVDRLDPQIGEVVLDPACGTGGFLVEAYKHLSAQADTVAQKGVVRRDSLLGGEAKSLPYLLAQMNLVLHGLESPQIDSGNSLRFKLADIGEGERVDVILTNPPFGGEEEVGIQGNFPLKSGETALLFLQLIMRKLRRQTKAGQRPSRAAVVVPNGTLFATGVAAEVKKQMLAEFNLHTIVRLGNGVFAPYTSIPTNLLFFDRSTSTTEVWYYEVPLPEGKKNYTKTQPMQFEDFADCAAWWNDRTENEQAWRVPVAEIVSSGYNLDRKNPHGKQDLVHLPPAELVASIMAKEQQIADIMKEIRQMLEVGR